MQLLGGNGADDRTTANICTPGTHFRLQGELVTEHCTNSSSSTFHGDQWVTLEIEVRGDESIRHKVNGITVFEYSGTQLDDTDPDAQRLLNAGAPDRSARRPHRNPGRKPPHPVPPHRGTAALARVATAFCWIKTVGGPGKYPEICSICLGG